MKSRPLNRYTLLIFAPILIATGALGLVTQSGTGPMSDAFAYDVFHIVFGVIGIGFVLLKQEKLVRAFNIGFGAIDLYQLVASLLGLFPLTYFRWKWGDDVAHGVIGVALILIGVLSRH
jgi:hypothetical protein